MHLGLGLAMLALASVPAVAQPTLKDMVDKALAPPPEAQTGADEKTYKDPLKRDVPRMAMKGFLTAARESDYARAAEFSTCVACRRRSAMGRRSRTISIRCSSVSCGSTSTD